MITISYLGMLMLMLMLMNFWMDDCEDEECEDEECAATSAAAKVFVISSNDACLDSCAETVG